MPKDVTVSVSEFRLNHLKRIFISWAGLVKTTERLSLQDSTSDFLINKKV